MESQDRSEKLDHPVVLVTRDSVDQQVEPVNLVPRVRLASKAVLVQLETRVQQVTSVLPERRVPAVKRESR
jgi:hypothetical protein